MKASLNPVCCAHSTSKRLHMISVNSLEIRISLPITIKNRHAERWAASSSSLPQLNLVKYSFMQWDFFFIIFLLRDAMRKCRSTSGIKSKTSEYNSSQRIAHSQPSAAGSRWQRMDEEGARNCCSWKQQCSCEFTHRDEKLRVEVGWQMGARAINGDREWEWDRIESKCVFVFREL